MKRKGIWGKSTLALALSACFGASQAELYFNVNSLDLTDEQKDQLDLSLLARTDIQMPGEYDVQVMVNRADVGRHTLSFVVCETRLCATLTPALLSSFGIKTSAIAGLAALPAEEPITDIERYIPDAQASFDFGQRRLSLSIPQAALENRARGYIAPEQWEHGVPMLFTSYSASGAETRQRSQGKHVSSQYVNLRSGLNYGPWRLRNNSYYNHNEGSGHEWNTMQTWLERDIALLKARVRAGETSSSGMLFDSFSFRGVSLTSQDEMLPESLQGFAPEIRGVASTNATVEIRQNGNLIYQTFVAPGEFVIRDLHALSTSGELQITIREENGVERSYLQSFAAPPVSVRKGVLKYSTTVGEFGSRNYQQSNSEPQKFVQGEFLYGVLNNTSLYGGLISAQHYQSGMAGIGLGMGDFGALSLDVTHAETEFHDGSKTQGQAWRMRYSKHFDKTNTSMTLAGHRYATEGYYDFDQASNMYHQSVAQRYAPKSRSQLSLSQNLQRFGSLGVSASQTDYWGNNQAKQRSMTGSWSKSFGSVSLSVNQSQSKSWQSGRTDHVTSASVSLPIGKWLSPGGGGSQQMTTSASYAQRGSTSFNTTVSGSALEGSALNYSLSQAHSRQASGLTNNSTSLAGTYTGGRGSANLGYSDYYGESTRLNWGVRGAVVAHPYGVTLSPPLGAGSGYALVRAPDAGGVKIQNRTGLKTDSRGYAVVPSLSPYRENRISLDTATLGDDVDIMQSIQRKVPTREALVLTDFETRIGHRVFLTLSHAGMPLPLGVTVSAGENSSLTNEKGQLFLSGVAPKALLQAALPGGQGCTIDFDSSKATLENGILLAELECV